MTKETCSSLSTRWKYGYHKAKGASWETHGCRTSLGLCICPRVMFRNRVLSISIFWTMTNVVGCQVSLKKYEWMVGHEPRLPREDAVKTGMSSLIRSSIMLHQQSFPWNDLSTQRAALLGPNKILSRIDRLFSITHLINLSNPWQKCRHPGCSATDKRQSRSRCVLLNGGKHFPMSCH